MFIRINWNPSDHELRKFGIAILIGFALIGCLFWWKISLAVAFWIWGISAFAGILALIAPPFSKPIYHVWMGMAFVMGTTISFLIVLTIFYMIITPVGLIMRLFGRDPLKLKKASFAENTYWHEHSDMSLKEIYKRLF